MKLYHQRASWMTPTLGRKTNCCRNCLIPLPTRFIKHETIQRQKNKPYLLASFIFYYLNFIFLNRFQCVLCPTKFWWFFLDYMDPADIPLPFIHPQYHSHNMSLLNGPSAPTSQSCRHHNSAQRKCQVTVSYCCPSFTL